MKWRHVVSNSPNSSVEYITTTFESTKRGVFYETMSGANITNGGLSSEIQFACGSGLLDSLIVNNTTYYNVFKQESQSTILYYKEQIGVIRKVQYNQNDTNTFDLQNHNVSFFAKP